MRLCVFCGSKMGHDHLPVIARLHQFVKKLGHRMAETQCQLIYGGGRVGLMGLLADSVLEKQGHVTGIIPDFMMTAEIAHHGLTDLQIVKSMHERKVAMFEQSDAFLALPGGYGTLDELFEVLTLSQLGLLDGSQGLRKPIMIYNDQDFFTPLLEQSDRMVEWGFLAPNYRQLIEVVQEEHELVTRLNFFTKR